MYQKKVIKSQLEQGIELNKYLQGEFKLLIAISGELSKAFASGNKLLLFGNGGSAADAQHIAAELAGKFCFDREPLPAIALTANTSSLTAIANDYGYEQVFVRQLKPLVSKGDVVIGISTSGNSQNVILAMEEARRRGAVTIAFTGRGGKLRQTADYALCIPSDSTARIQEAHITAGHIICYLVEESLFGQARKNAAVFLDRDGTIARDVPYCSRPEDFALLPGAGKAIKLLNDAGFKVIVITNQSGVSRKYFSEEILVKIHRKMMNDLAGFGARIDAIYYCPHHPDDDCDCRKPKPGLILKAAQEHNIDLVASYIVGDKPQDIEAGIAAGCQTVLLSPRGKLKPDTGNAKHSIVVKSLAQAVKYIIGAKELEPGK